jgi:hypothetical protein
MRDSKKGVERGQTITFRVPSDTPDYLLKQLQRLKETERRNFSSKIAQFVMQGVNDTFAKERETITIPLPKQLSKAQRNWMKHEHSEALIGTIVYQLLSDPLRATSILAQLNSNSVDIEQALYLQEEAATIPQPRFNEHDSTNEERNWSSEDDLNDINLDTLHGDLHTETVEDDPEEDEDPLADFFSSMNK